MSSLLNSLAVGRKDGEDAKEIFGSFLGTAPAMALNHSAPTAAPTNAQTPPTGSGAVDPLNR